VASLQVLQNARLFAVFSGIGSETEVTEQLYSGKIDYERQLFMTTTLRLKNMKKPE
jgi:hypothetical protein